MEIKITLIHILTVSMLLIATVAIFTLAERKSMAGIQRRKGPDVLGFWGFLQPMADGAKLVLKEMIIPYRGAVFLFFIGPILVFTLSLANWAVIPFSFLAMISSIHLSIIYTFVISGLAIYGLILAGWSSNSRYAFLGSIRATAQMISYELLLGSVNVCIGFFAGSYNYIDIVNAQAHVWFFVPLFPLFVLYLIVMLAETNRTPFDLAESEAELVAGYNVEYSSIMFAMFFLGEYANMILLSVICVLYFFGGWGFSFTFLSSVFFICKILFFTFFFVWVRATLPRLRYDQLMTFGWKHLLPFVFGLLIFLFSVVLVFGIRNESLFFNNQELLYYVYVVQQLTPLNNLVNITISFFNIELNNLIEQIDFVSIQTDIPVQQIAVVAEKPIQVSFLSHYTEILVQQISVAKKQVLSARILNKYSFFGLCCVIFVGHFITMCHRKMF